MEGYHLSALHHADAAQGQSDQALPPFPAGGGLFRLSCRLLPGPAALTERPSRALRQPARRLRHASPCRRGLAVGCASDYSSFICIQPESVDRVRVKQGLIFFGAGLAAGDGGLGRRPVPEDHGRGQGRAGQSGAGLEVTALPDRSSGSRGLRGADLGFLRLCEPADGIGLAAVSAARPVCRDGGCSAQDSPSRAPACRASVGGAGGNPASPTTAICAIRSAPRMSSPRPGRRNSEHGAARAGRAGDHGLAARGARDLPPGRRAGGRNHADRPAGARDRGGGPLDGTQDDPRSAAGDRRRDLTAGAGQPVLRGRGRGAECHRSRPRAARRQAGGFRGSRASRAILRRHPYAMPACRSPGYRAAVSPLCRQPRPADPLGQAARSSMPAARRR